jgi:hypothetical protein
MAFSADATNASIDRRQAAQVMGYAHLNSLSGFGVRPRSTFRAPDSFEQLLFEPLASLAVGVMTANFSVIARPFGNGKVSRSWRLTASGASSGYH